MLGFFAQQKRTFLRLIIRNGLLRAIVMLTLRKLSAYMYLFEVFLSNICNCGLLVTFILFVFKPFQWDSKVRSYFARYDGTEVLCLVNRLAAESSAVLRRSSGSPRIQE